MLGKVIERAAAIVTGLALILLLLFCVIEGVAFDRGRYQDAYERFDRPEFIGISMEELMDVTDEMILYLKGDRPDLDMQAEIDGQVQEVFGEREKLHMVDVEELFAAGYTIRRLAAAVAAAGIAAMIVVKRRQAARTLCKGYIWAMAGFGALIAAVGIYMAVDFTAAFTDFHLLLFDNDLWLLDINTEVLIQMFPEQFFGEMAAAMLGWGIAAVAVPLIAAIIYLVVERKRAKAK